MVKEILMARKYKCPYCNKKYERAKLITHINRVHDDMIPEGYTASRIVFDVANPNTKHVCRVCGRDVQWNEKAGRYNVLCGNPKCKEAMREEYKKNMLRVKGTYNILNDPEQQKAMLAGRRISGKYKFQDGGVIEYTGTYEKNFLEFLDNVMNIPSSDIMAPGPTIEYEYNGEKHIYIPDFYYIPYNLIIEVKDGGDNPNTKTSSSMIASREKTIAKERVISDKGEYNYLRLTNNQFAQFIDILMDIKENIMNGNIDTKTMKIHNFTGLFGYKESTINEEAIQTPTAYFYNGKEFLSNKINLCFIVGFSGSGKTTLAHEYERQYPDIEVEHLDILVSNFSYSDDEIKHQSPMIYEFLNTSGKKWRLKEEPDDVQYTAEMVRDFNKYAMDYAKKHRYKRYVVEGIWTLYSNNPDELKDYGVIIIRTSLFTSKVRATQRNNEYNKGSAIDFIRRLLSNISDYKQDERLLNDYLHKLVLLNGEQRSVNEYSLILKPMNNNDKVKFAKDILDVVNRYINDNKMEIKRYLSDNGLRNLHPYIETVDLMIVISLVEGDYSGERFKYEYEELGENIVEYIKSSPEFKKQNKRYITRIIYKDGKILINV